MKFLMLLVILFNSICFSKEAWKREASGFSETESFSFEKNKVILYKNNTTWKDTKGNYGTSKCFGLIVSNEKQAISDYKMYCNFIDQDMHTFTHQYYRDTEFSGGVGKSVLISGDAKWTEFIGTKCTYAIDYLKKALFLVERCS